MSEAAATYVLKWRRRFFWRRITAFTHRYDSHQDKLLVFKPGGALIEISNWSQCEARLGEDWVFACRQQAAARATAPAASTGGRGAAAGAPVGLPLAAEERPN